MGDGVSPQCAKNPHGKHHVWQRYFEHDETGGFVKCDWCDEVTFLDGVDIRKFLKDIAKGVSAEEIHNAIHPVATEYKVANNTSANKRKRKQVRKSGKRTASAVR